MNGFEAELRMPPVPEIVSQMIESSRLISPVTCPTRANKDGVQHNPVQMAKYVNLFAISNCFSALSFCAKKFIRCVGSYF